MKTGKIFNKRNAIGVLVVLGIGVAARAMQAQDSFGEEIFSSGLELGTTMPQRAPAAAPVPVASSSLPDIELSIDFDEPILGGVPQDPFGIEPARPATTAATPQPMPPATPAVQAQPQPQRAPTPPPTPPRQQQAARSGAPDDALLGRISNDMLRELADIDRENARLELELRREQLRSDISNAQATQRRARLEEIQRREDMIRLQEEWKMERARREQELVEARERAQLRRRQIETALDRADQAANQGMRGNEQGQGSFGGAGFGGAAGGASPNAASRAMEVSDLYVVMEVRGTGDDLSARIASTDGSQMRRLSVGGMLPTGHIIEEISTEGVFVSKDGRIWQLHMFNESLRQPSIMRDVMMNNSQPFGQGQMGGQGWHPGMMGGMGGMHGGGMF